MLAAPCVLRLPRPWPRWELSLLRSLKRLHHLTHRHLQKTFEGGVPAVQIELLLNHVTHAAIAPVLVLLEKLDETPASHAGEPGGGHRLNRPAHEKGRNTEAERCADDTHGTLQESQARQGPSKGHGQFPRPLL